MNLLQKLYRRIGRKIGLAVYETAADGMNYALFSFTRPDGSFDYEQYRKVQEDANKAKIGKVFADERTMDFLAEYLQRSMPKIERGICHGTRRGLEQKWLAERLSAEVVGTEISETATQFPNTVQWDFHEENTDWLGAFDFVYSNSHDHAYDPRKALSAWVRQLRPHGAVILEHTSQHTEEHASRMDPFGVRPDVLPYLVAKWGAGKFAVTEVLEPPFNKPNGSKIWLFVIRPLAFRTATSGE
jgi:SAM-dependent methyltransferase